MCHLCSKKQNKTSSCGHVQKSCKCGKCHQCYKEKQSSCTYSKHDSFCAPEPPVCAKKCCTVPTPAPAPVKAYGSIYAKGNPASLAYVPLDSTYDIPVGNGTLSLSQANVNSLLGASSSAGFVFAKQLPLVVGSSSLYNTTVTTGGLTITPGGADHLTYDVTINSFSGSLSYVLTSEARESEPDLKYTISSVIVAQNGTSFNTVDGSERLLALFNKISTPFQGGVTGTTGTLNFNSLDLTSNNVFHTSGEILQNFSPGTKFYLVLVSSIYDFPSEILDVTTFTGQNIVFYGLPDGVTSASLTGVLEQQITLS